jgi:hypothetical protein
MNKNLITAYEKNLPYSSTAYIFLITRTRVMKIWDNIHHVAIDYMPKFQHFWICNKGEK